MTAPSGNDRPVNMWEELNKPKERAGAPQVAPDSQPTDSDDNAKVVGALVIGGIAMLVIALSGFILFSGGPSAEEDASAAAPATDQLALVADEESAETIDGVDTDEAAEDDVPAVDSRDSYSPAVPAGAEGRYVVLSRGKLYLRGEIPSPLIEAGAVNALEEIMGVGNVVSEYVINPEAEFVMGAPADVYIEDTVLFEFGSAQIAEDFYPLLGLGTVLLGLQDGVTIELYGHTDATGPESANLILSQARVDAVKAFWVSQGVDPERITAIGRGERDPVASNDTREGQQLNRRVEIIINGFVFSL